MLRAYPLCYDVGDAKRLRRMHKLAMAFGRPLQYSVFACVLRRDDRVRLAARIEALIDHKRDRVIILDIGTVTDRESWIPPMQVFGSQEVVPERSAVIV